MPAVVTEALVATGCMLLLAVMLFPDVVFLERTTTTSGFSAGVLGSPPHAGYPDGVILERNPYLRDTLASAVASEPAAEYVAGLTDDPGRALWDPHRSLGSPVLATGDPQLVSPIRWPLAVVPTPLAWDVFTLLRLVATGVLTHLLAWRLGYSRWSSVAAAVVVAAGGFTALHNNSVHVDQLLALTAGMHAVLSFGRRRTALSTLAVGATAAVVVVADNLQAGVIGVVLLSGFALHVLRRADVPRSQALLLALTPAVLGGALTAFVLAPMIELAGSPITDGESFHLHMDDRGLAHLSPQAIADVLVPYVGIGSSPDLDINLGFGLVVAFLAVLGALGRGPHRRFLVVATGILLLKLFGVPVINEVGRLPVLSGINFMLYTAAPLQLLVGLLVGAGVERAVTRELALTEAATVAGLVAAVAWPVVVWRTPAVDRTGLLAVHLVLLVVAAAVVIGHRHRLPWAPRVLAVVVAAQIAVVWLPRLGAVVYDGPVERVLGLEVVDRPARSDPFDAPAFVTELQERMRPGDRVVAHGGRLYPNTAGAFAIEDLRGMSAFTVERFHALLTTFLDHRDPWRFDGRGWGDLIDERAHPRLPEVLDLLGVEWFVMHHPIPDETITGRYPELELAFRGPHAMLYRNPDALDRAFLVQQAIAVDSLQEAMDVMEEPSTDLRTTAVVETDHVPTMSAAQATGEVTTLELSAARHRFRVDAPDTRLLVVSSTYYPGWRARVDGEPVDVLPAYGALQAVVVPAGEHEVELVFRPTSVLVGGAVSLAASIALVGAAVAGAIRRRRSEQVASTADAARHVPA